MEIAGVVLGAFPVAITTLKCYTSVKRIGDNWKNRQRHLEFLIHALGGCEAILDSSTEWLLISVGASQSEHHTPEQLADILQNGETLDEIRTFLGKSCEAYQDAIYEAQEAMLEIFKNIKGFFDLKCRQSLLVAARRKQSDIKLQFCNGFKFCLQRHEIDQQIRNLDRAAQTVTQIMKIRGEIRQLEVAAPLKNIKRCTDILARLRSNAIQLFQSLSWGWPPGCPCNHTTRLYLDDRITSLFPSRAGKKRPSTSFKLAFDVKPTQSNIEPVWCESEVDVNQDDECFDCMGTSSSSTNASNRVSFHPSLTALPHIPASSACIDNLCLLVRSTVQQQSNLQLFLCQHYKLHGDQNPPAHASNNNSPVLGASSPEVVSLEKIISAAASPAQSGTPMGAMYPKPRLLLSLTLASTLMQLYQTPWLGDWSTSAIHFFIQPSQSRIADIKRPLVSQLFKGASTHTPIGIPANSDPRAAVLELGIMMLEIENQTTFEEYCSKAQRPANTDRFIRSSNANCWLEASEDQMLQPLWEATARCIRFQFDGLSLQVSWDDPALHIGMLKGVIQPLQSLCKPT